MLRFEFGVVKTFYWSGARASQGELRATSSDRIRPPNAKWNTPTWRGVGDVRCNKIFISHNMPKDSDAASSIEQLFAFYSGSKMKMILAEDFQKKGGQRTPGITAAIQSAGIFILLYTNEDQDPGSR